MKNLAIFLILLIFNIINLHGKSLTPAEDQRQFEQLKSKGASASMTILPTTLGPKPNEQVGLVVGIMLEKCGMNNLEFVNLEFNPANTDFENSRNEFSTFVAQNTFKTDYVFYSRILFKERSIAETWCIVANKIGEIVWADQQTKDDKEFNKAQPRDPMSACLFLTDRFRSKLGLAEMNEKAPAGRIEKMADRASGIPNEEERKAIKEREKIFKNEIKNSKRVVYAPRILENRVEKQCAENLSTMLNKHSMCNAFVSDNNPVLTFDKSKPGQPAILWSVARGFQQTVREDKPAADYALYAHYGYFADRKSAGFIHVIVCDKNGDWVLADIANSHHDDFQKTDWQNLAACDQFVVNRLLSSLK